MCTFERRRCSILCEWRVNLTVVVSNLPFPWNRSFRSPTPHPGHRTIDRCSLIYGSKWSRFVFVFSGNHGVQLCLERRFIHKLRAASVPLFGAVCEQLVCLWPVIFRVENRFRSYASAFSFLNLLCLRNSSKTYSYFCSYSYDFEIPPSMQGSSFSCLTGIKFLDELVWACSIWLPLALHLRGELGSHHVELEAVPSWPTTHAFWAIPVLQHQCLLFCSHFTDSMQARLSTPLRIGTLHSVSWQLVLDRLNETPSAIAFHLP